MLSNNSKKHIAANVFEYLIRKKIIQEEGSELEGHHFPNSVVPLVFFWPTPQETWAHGVHDP